MLRARRCGWPCQKMLCFLPTGLGRSPAHPCRFARLNFPPPSRRRPAQTGLPGGGCVRSQCFSTGRLGGLHRAGLFPPCVSPSALPVGKRCGRSRGRAVVRTRGQGRGDEAGVRTARAGFLRRVAALRVLAHPRRCWFSRGARTRGVRARLGLVCDVPLQGRCHAPAWTALAGVLSGRGGGLASFARCTPNPLLILLTASVAAAALREPGLGCSCSGIARALPRGFPYRTTFR